MKVISLKKNVALLTTLTLILSASIFSFAATKTLSLYFERQQYAAWCWAATSQSIIDKVAGRRPTQSQIVYNIKGTCNGTEGGNVNDNAQSLWAWGVGTTVTNYRAPMSFSSIKINIDNNKPVKALVQYNGSGHALVVYGYYEYGSDQQIYYLDPWPSHPLCTAVRINDFNNGSVTVVDYELYNNYKTY